jgi:carbamoylphosphate synthase large subunit
LDLAALPAEIADVGAQAVLAEEAMSGRQAAVEGYSFNGEATIYGTLDSLNYEGTSSFQRHQYPSQLPERTVRHMAEVARRVIEHIGLDNTAFSVEFFCRPETGEVCVLEINPRHSQSHAELFNHVDGAPNHHCMLRLALGREPAMPYRQGDYAIAAKYYHRRFDGDAVVTRVPTADEVAAVESDIDGVGVHLIPGEGDRLSDMEGQDSYSYELAHLVVAGADVDDMERKFREATGRLRFEFEEG